MAHAPLLRITTWSASTRWPFVTVARALQRGRNTLVVLTRGDADACRLVNENLSRTHADVRAAEPEALEAGLSTGREVIAGMTQEAAPEVVALAFSESTLWWASVGSWDYSLFVLGSEAVRLPSSPAILSALPAEASAEPAEVQAAPEVAHPTLSSASDDIELGQLRLRGGERLVAANRPLVIPADWRARVGPGTPPREAADALAAQCTKGDLAIAIIDVVRVPRPRYELWLLGGLGAMMLGLVTSWLILSILFPSVASPTAVTPLQRGTVAPVAGPEDELLVEPSSEPEPPPDDARPDEAALLQPSRPLPPLPPRLPRLGEAERGLAVAHNRAIFDGCSEAHAALVDWLRRTRGASAHSAEEIADEIYARQVGQSVKMPDGRLSIAHLREIGIDCRTRR